MSIFMLKMLSNQVLKINESAPSFRLKGVDGKSIINYGTQTGFRSY